MSVLVCISGKAGSGKDTVANMVFELLSSFEGLAPRVVGLADEMKRRYCLNVGLDPSVMTRGTEIREVKCEHRPALIAYATEAKSRDENVWGKALIESLTGNERTVIVPDVRYPHEVEFLQQHFLDVVCVLVTRPGVESGTDPSETSMDGYPFDLVISNDSTLSALTDQVRDFLLGRVVPDKYRGLITPRSCNKGSSLPEQSLSSG